MSANDSVSTSASTATSGTTANEEEKKAPVSRGRITIDDFTVEKFLGEGAFARVVLAKKTTSGKEFAIKIIEKKHIKREKKEAQIYMERHVLSKLKHPNIIKLYSTFQDVENLYFVLELCRNGELFAKLKKYGKLPLDLTAFYTAEIVNVLEYIHLQGVFHRDLKPENVLIDHNGHIKVSDWGTAKIIGDQDAITPTQAKTKRATFVGTAEYVSPELLKDEESSPASDLWALGCMVFQMISGRSPFKAKTEYLCFDKILARQLDFTAEFSDAAKDLIDKLLVVNPADRLGAGAPGTELDFEHLKKHPFFEEIDFNDLHEQEPPNLPVILSPFKNLEDSSGSGDADDMVLRSESRSSSAMFDDDDDGEREIRESEISDDILKSGLVQKKCGWFFYKERLLTLRSKPRLLYYDPEKKALKGEITLNSSIYAEISGPGSFNLNTPTRVYYFKDIYGAPEKWVDMINNTINSSC
eukprot:CAMPEP_0115010450 /NCGR_PEP_ID=MMETSP0216-20121206/23326_1 /TAXON_ID=223996 /ORGANISM="Protocruzia adherens, Strain Boccale" /LENGTH=469 /DNA_ID=CAMNT_0002378673 /DNA_START=165 /DNA_END=1574 /DNA_ORIENTATION=-